MAGLEKAWAAVQHSLVRSTRTLDKARYLSWVWFGKKQNMFHVMASSGWWTAAKAQDFVCLSSVLWQQHQRKVLSVREEILLHFAG